MKGHSDNPGILVKASTWNSRRLEAVSATDRPLGVHSAADSPSAFPLSLEYSHRSNWDTGRGDRRLGNSLTTCINFNHCSHMPHRQIPFGDRDDSYQLPRSCLYYLKRKSSCEIWQDNHSAHNSLLINKIKQCVHVKIRVLINMTGRELCRVMEARLFAHRERPSWIF